MKEYQQVCVSGFILNKKNQLLLVKRSDDDDFLPGLWELPGGGTDFGENPIDAVKREIVEEVGLSIVVGKPLSVEDYFMPIRQAQGEENIHRVEIFLLCKVTSADQEVILSHEHSAFQWIAKEKLKDIEMTEYMTKTITTCFANL